MAKRPSSRPPSQRQLSYLRALSGGLGVPTPTPQTAAEAGRAIGHLKRLLAERKALRLLEREPEFVANAGGIKRRIETSRKQQARYEQRRAERKAARAAKHPP